MGEIVRRKHMRFALISIALSAALLGAAAALSVPTSDADNATTEKPISDLEALKRLRAGEDIDHDDRVFNESQYADTARSLTVEELFAIRDDKWVEGILEQMTLEEKVGQLIMPHIWGSRHLSDTAKFARLERAINELHVGGFIFFNGDADKQAALANALQDLSWVPLFIASDFERGVDQRLEGATGFPYQMAIGAADDWRLTYRMGRVVADEARAIGAQINFSPVADVNDNPDNPVINLRAFGESGRPVARHANALARGLQDGGVLACVKHYPGHGGVDVDTHRDIAVLYESEASLRQTELYPFESAIRKGVMGVMVGHLGAAAFGEADKPATLSKKMTTDILRGELGFEGLIFTDAMNMKAITKSYSQGEAAVLALQAGADVIVFPEDEAAAFYGIVEAVKSGTLSEERIEESARKVLLAKMWAGLDRERLVSESRAASVKNNHKHLAVAREIAERSITLVRNDEELIPLEYDSTKSYYHVAVLDHNKNVETWHFIDTLERSVPTLETVILPRERSRWKTRRRAIRALYDAALDSAKTKDVLILSIYLKMRNGVGSIKPDADQMELIASLLALGKPTIVVSHGSPYILGDLDGVSTYVCSYGNPDASEIAAAKAIAGEIDIRGRLPVSLPNTSHRRGEGIYFDKALYDLMRDSSRIAEIEDPRFAAVDAMIEKAIADSAFPGAVLLVGNDSTVVYRRAYGYHTYEPGAEPMTTTTIFDLASLTKVVATTTAAMILVDRGLIDLDDPVAKHLPAFAANGKEDVKIRNLLVHNSGLIPFRLYYSMYETREEILEAIYAEELIYPVGSEMRYSDLNMILMMKIIEEATGKSFDDFCRSSIFEPLEMIDTRFNPPASLRDRIAPTELDDYWRHKLVHGTVHDENAWALGGVSGHAGLFSTAPDLSNLLKMLLHKGEYKGKRIVKRATVEKFTSRQSDQSSRGLGWDTKWTGASSGGKRISVGSYGHTGFTGTSLWTDKKRGVYVVLLTNRVHPTRENRKLYAVRGAIHDAIIDALEK